MYKIQKVIKTTVLVAGLFGFVGCGGECCEGDVSISKGVPFETPKVIENGTGTPQGEEKKKIEPIPPIAVATMNENDFNITIKPCDVVYFDSNKSTDPDGNVSSMSYVWSKLDGSTISEEKSFFHKFNSKGVYEITLTVTDEQDLNSTDTVLVTVKSPCE